jgi:hypothetical protein
MKMMTTTTQAAASAPAIAAIILHQPTRRVTAIPLENRPRTVIPVNPGTLAMPSIIEPSGTVMPIPRNGMSQFTMPRIKSVTRTQLPAIITQENPPAAQKSLP